MSTPQLYHCLRYTDADRGIAFLETLGFVTARVERDDTDPSVIAHAQLNWRDTGGVMLGTVRDADPHYGPGICNLVVEDDAQVDVLVDAAVAAGASVVTEPNYAPYGGRNACVADFDGHWWNIDSYPGV